jgi:hypothetical protein
MAREGREAAMDGWLRNPWRRWRELDPAARSSLLCCSLIALTLVTWVAGWAWVAVPAGLGALDFAAAAVGADSRMPGDWRRIGSG